MNDAVIYKGQTYKKVDLENPIKGGKGGDFTPTPTALSKGIKVEKEHVGSLKNPAKRAIAKDIAKDHLAEFPNYYDELEKMEKKLEKEKESD